MLKTKTTWRARNLTKCMPHNPLNTSTLKESLNAFIQVTKYNHVKGNQSIDSQETSIKSVKVQKGQLDEHVQVSRREDA